MKNHQINLIDNSYPMSDARDLMVSLLDQKIKYLNLQQFIMNERYGMDSLDHKNQIEKFTREKERLTQTLKSLEKPDCKVEINCSATLNLKEDNRNVQ